LWYNERILPGLDRLCGLRPQANDLSRQASGLARAGAISFAQGSTDEQKKLISIERDDFRTLSVKHPRQAMCGGFAHPTALFAARGHFRGGP
jgi:hypothetical protein